MFTDEYSLLCVYHSFTNQRTAILLRKGMVFLPYSPVKYSNSRDITGIKSLRYHFLCLSRPPPRPTAKALLSPPAGHTWMGKLGLRQKDLSSSGRGSGSPHTTALPSASGACPVGPATSLQVRWGTTALRAGKPHGPQRLAEAHVWWIGVVVRVCVCGTQSYLIALSSQPFAPSLSRVPPSFIYGTLKNNNNKVFWVWLTSSDSLVYCFYSVLEAGPFRWRETREFT